MLALFTFLEELGSGDRVGSMQYLNKNPSVFVLLEHVQVQGNSFILFIAG